MALPRRDSDDEDEPATEPARDLPALAAQLDADEDNNEPRTETTRFTSDLVTRAVTGAAHERFRFVVMEGGPLGSAVPIGTPFTIGRDADNTLVLGATGVSRTHALVMWDQDAHVLHDQGSANGTLVNRHRVTSHRLQDGDLVMLGGAALKYLAVDNPEYRFLEQLHAATVRDPLTGAPNRRYFDDFCEREIERSVRYHRPLALLMLDIDHFKRVNDTHGHPAGDAVLRDLVRVVSSRLRRSEFMARFGGEEFAVVAPETSPTGAAKLGEVLRALVQRHPFAFGGKPIPITISVGVAAWTPDLKNAADLVATADRRLYAAKHLGRNRVISAD